MKIQEAIAAAREGKLIRRMAWRNGRKPKLFPVPHYQYHVALIKDDNNGDRWVNRDQFMPGAFTWDHHFSVEEIMAEDWEILDDGCDCVECDPERHEDQPIKVGDLIERYPCNGLRIIWAVEKLSDNYAYGTVYRIFEGERELHFEVEPGEYPKIKILNPDGFNYRDWISCSSQSAELAKIHRGLLHNWPRFGTTHGMGGSYHGVLQCRLTGERLEQLRRYETQQRIVALTTPDNPERPRAVAASPRPQR